MADEPLDASPAETAAAPEEAAGATAAAPVEAAAAAATASSPPRLRPRRVAFEHGLLPIPKLVFPEGTLTQTLAQLKERLSSSSASAPARVGAAALAEALQIPTEQAALALGTLAAVLPADDPALGEDGAGDADLRDVLLFLYIQSFKRLVPRSHKDSPAVADVWPSTSAFDGYLSALSPIQLVRSNSRRFVPSQVDEEAHQLSYLQKHMANILTLLADSVDGEGDESMVLTMETFERLGFLLQFSEGTPLSQVATFFANSDPDMPAAPVPAPQVHDWILQCIASSLEYTSAKSTAKENSQQSASDPDVTMADAVTNTRIQSSSPSGTSVPSPGHYRNTNFVEGLSKTSVVKQASDIKGHSMKVLNCHDSVIYILAPVKYATIYGCSDTTVVLGAVGKVVKVEHCERVQIIAASKRICIANCRECIFYLGVNHQPLIVGDNHKLQVAPFNTYYPQLGDHLAQVGVDPNINKWDQPFVLGVVDPHDSLTHPAGVSDVQAESATCLDPDLFTNFLIPSWFETQGPTTYNPFTLPEVYWASQRKKHVSVEDIQKNIRELELDDNRKKELACALHAQFKDWLYASGNIRQLYCLQGE